MKPSRAATADRRHYAPPADGDETDRLLVSRAADGDERAFQALVRKHETAVARVVVAMLGPGDEADDVGQEAFVQLCRSISKFRGDASIRTYLIRIAINRSVDQLRRRRRTRGWLRLSLGDGGATEEALHVPPANDFDQEDDREMVRNAIETLEPHHRAVVVLRFMDGLSTRDAANVLGVPEGTVMSRLKRALDKLQTILRPAMSR